MRDKISKTILVVDDDIHIGELVKLYLQKEDYRVQIVTDGEEAVKVFSEIAPHLVILDLMLPGMDGLEVCREIRKLSHIPIIMLTAKGESFDKVLGLEMGADDYVVKPFDPKELVARVRAVLRRSEPYEMEKLQIVFPGLVVDKGRYIIKVDEQDISATPKEIELLYFLADHPDQVFTREQLLEHIWGYDYMGDSRTVDVHIKRLREKLGEENSFWKIKTVWGVGYKFEVKR